MTVRIRFSAALARRLLLASVSIYSVYAEAQGQLRLKETSGVHHVGFQAPASISADRLWTLPAADGSANMCLATDGSGSLSWRAVGGGAGDFLANGSVAMTGALQAAPGTTALPGYTFSGDTNTGMSAATADTLAFSTAGSGRLLIMPTGKVGIGTTPSNAVLQITDASSGPTLAVGPTTQNDGQAYLSLRTKSGGVTNEAMIVAGDSGELQLKPQPGQDAVFLNGGTPLVTIESTGRVGIGVTAPTTKLQVNSAGAGTGFRLADGSQGAGKYLVSDANGSASWATMPAGGAAGGSNTQIQYNSGGSLAGSSSLTWDSTNQVLAITKSTAAAGNLFTLQSTSTTGYSEFTLKNSGGTNVGWFGYGNAGAAAHADKVYVEAAGSRDLRLATNSSDRVTIDSNGKVGIGTTSPAWPLHIVSSGTGWVMAESTGTGSSAQFIAKNDASKSLSTGVFDSAASTYFDINANDAFVLSDYGTTPLKIRSTGELSLGVGPAQHLTVTSAGNVGIGATAPFYKFQVLGALNSATSPFNATLTDSAAYAADVGGGLSFGGYYNGSSTSNFAGIRGGKENATANDTAGYLALYSHPNGGDPTERVRVSSGGNVGIGTTSPASILHVAYDTAGGTIVTLGLGRANDYGLMDVKANPSATDGYTMAGIRSYSSMVSADTLVGRLGFYKDGTGTDNKTYFSLHTHNGSTYGERVRVDSAGKVGIGTGAPTALLDVAGNTKLGSAGVAFTAMGACTTASISATVAGVSTACTGIPTGVAVTCSPSAAVGSFVISANVTTAGNVIVHASGAASAATYHCMWMKP